MRYTVRRGAHVSGARYGEQGSTDAGRTVQSGHPARPDSNSDRPEAACSALSDILPVTIYSSMLTCQPACLRVFACVA